MLRLVFIAFMLVVAGVLLLAALRPGTFRVSRSIRIQAPPDRIFPLINDLRAFGTWSPYERKDPSMKRVFSGAPAGTGSVYEFDGNSQVGKGRLTITDAKPLSSVTIALDMLTPIEARNVVDFSLTPDGDATRVTWTMTGCNGFVGKVLGVFINMDRMVGRDFEAGLASLRDLAESRRPALTMEASS